MPPPPHQKAPLFQPGNRNAAGRRQPLSARDPIKALDNLLKLVVDRLLYCTIQQEKDGKKYGTRVANVVTPNVANAVTNAVRLRLDIHAQFAVSARLEAQTAELVELTKEMERIKRRALA